MSNDPDGSIHSNDFLGGSLAAPLRRRRKYSLRLGGVPEPANFQPELGRLLSCSGRIVFGAEHA
jgi:hypothetical protein